MHVTLKAQNYYHSIFYILKHISDSLEHITSNFIKIVNEGEHSW